MAVKEPTEYINIDNYFDKGEGSYYIKSEADAYIRHQKYKRCLAMADLCYEKHCRIAADVDDGYDTDKEYRQFMSNFWIEWKCKWMELEEKFREEK